MVSCCISFCIYYSGPYFISEICSIFLLLYSVLALSQFIYPFSWQEYSEFLFKPVFITINSSTVVLFEMSFAYLESFLKYLFICVGGGPCTYCEDNWQELTCLFNWDNSSGKTHSKCEQYHPLCCGPEPAQRRTVS